MHRRRTILGVLSFIALGAAGAPVTDDFLLAPNRVGKIVIGMSESAIYKVYARRITRKVDLQLEGGPTPAVQVFLTKDRQHPSLVIRLDGPAHGVHGVEVMDPRFRTARGVGPGSSLGQLRSAEKQLSLVVGEGVIGASDDDLSMTFKVTLDNAAENRLFEDIRHYPGANDLSMISADTRIESVWVYRHP